MYSARCVVLSRAVRVALLLSAGICVRYMEGNGDVGVVLVSNLYVKLTSVWDLEALLVRERDLIICFFFS